jgi:(p)ppGpp synthase/HD superfamily hydrolase
MALELMDHLLIDRARLIAEKAHRDQVDKAGRPYIEHVARVADRVDGGIEKAVAWLHDVLEDTLLEAPDLRYKGMPEEVVQAVLAITHRPHEPRVDYYARVKADRYALVVKLADVADNSDPDRLAWLDVATRDRLAAKYATAREILEG